jgi:protocatechuate 3,4-dioxygenase, alpha subunit
MPGQTPWQTVGPFFHYGLIREGGADLVADGHDGRIAIVGRVVDGDGQPVPDALVEIWQADAAGRYAHPDDPNHHAADPSFPGFGRSATADDGSFRFLTIRPGRVAGPGNSLQAPHIAVGIMARGMLKRLTTRLYFADAPENAEDPILALVPPTRRDTLIAKREGDAWRFDIVLQGDAETVFLDC